MVFMFGIPDWGIWLAYIFCIASVVLCVIYGFVNWNKGVDDEEIQIDEELQWETKEKEIESNL